MFCHKSDIDGNWAVMLYQCFLLGILVLLLLFTPGSNYLLPAKKLISIIVNATYKQYNQVHIFAEILASVPSSVLG